MKRKIGKRAIQSELRKCVFDPEENEAFRIIFDHQGCNYWEQRAVDLIRGGDNYQMAIQLLIYSKLYREMNK
jgi:hypothetical protein